MFPRLFSIGGFTLHTYGVLVATGIAELVLKFIRHVGGFLLLQPQSTFNPIRFLYQNVWGMVEDLLTLFGADFSGDQVGASALVPLLHLVGVALAGWALVRAFRGFGQHGLAVQVLAVTSVVVLVAYVLRDQGGGGPARAHRGHDLLRS